jgi:arylsulfatase A-like enzyme
MHSEWFAPRRGLPDVPPQLLPDIPKQPIVILFTVDALRGDVIDAPDSKKSVPNLVAMAKRSLRFTRTWSPASATQPSLRSLFIGTYYTQLPPKRARPKGPHIATLLGRAGVPSVNVVAAAPLVQGRGICEGFSEEHVLGHLAPSAQIVDAILAKLDERKHGPLFVYSHTLDAHAPYDRGGKRGSLKRRYLAEVAGVDAAIGRLRRELKQRKLDSSTYLIVTADHGEAFGEHGRNYHATTVYEEMIRIPLLIEGPGIERRRVEQSASLMDVGPTILSLFGVATPSHFMGQSLVPFMRGETPKLTRPLVVDGHRRMQSMLFDERIKAIVDLRQGTEEIYDLVEDPGEQRNLAEQPQARAYFDKLRAFFAALSPEPVPPQAAGKPRRN